MDNIYIGFCLNDFIEFNNYVDFINLKKAKTAYIFENTNQSLMMNDNKKIQTLKNLAVTLVLHRKDGSIEYFPKNPKGKINVISIFLLDYNVTLNQILIEHREDSIFYLYIPKCSSLMYKELIEKFKECKIFIYGRDIIKVVKDLISDPKIKKNDMITYLNYLKEFKITSFKNNICIWENNVDIDESYITSSENNSKLSNFVSRLDKMF